ncbi:MAG: DUF3105 domain-containing protein [Dehalococcoidia bacterium]
MTQLVSGGEDGMNREQQRQNARDQKRLERRQKMRQNGARPSEPVLGKRPAAKTAVGPAAPARRQLPSWWPWAAVAAVLGLFAALLIVVDPLGLRAPLPGKKVASQGNLHVNPGQTHVQYITDPPASGPHFPTVPRRGIYTTPFITEYLPHFMEHGGVEVQYNKDASPVVVKKLTDIVNKDLDFNIGQVLLAPRPDMPCQVALTAWQHIETFGSANCQPGSVGHDFSASSSADADKVRSFIERDMCAYDPENQCGQGIKGSTDNATPKPGEPTVTASLGTATPAPAASTTPAATPAAGTPGSAPATAAPTPAP